jgi:hypothetical protein
MEFGRMPHHVSRRFSKMLIVSSQRDTALHQGLGQEPSCSSQLLDFVR